MRFIFFKFKTTVVTRLFYFFLLCEKMLAFQQFFLVFANEPFNLMHPFLNVKNFQLNEKNFNYGIY